MRRRNHKDTKTQRLLIVLISFVSLCLCGFSSQQSSPRNHIILLDASGSMKERYASGLRDWLIAPLLNSGAIASGDRVIVRTFDKRGSSDFIKEDPKRRYQGKLDRDQILAAIPASNESLGGRTAIEEALEISIADIQAFNLSGDTLIWLVTDNVQDETGSGDDPISPFYERIYNDPNFKNIYFFPLVREQETSALVMYVLDYNKTETTIPMPALMDQVGKAIGQRPVLFRPIRLSALDIDRSSILFEGENGDSRAADLEDSRIVVPLPAGQTLTGRLKFKLKSKFREWKIEQANISNAAVTIDYSPSLDLSEGESLQWQLDPRTLDIGPQETSKRTYAIDLASGGRALGSVAPSFWRSFFVEPEVKVPGMVRFEVEEPQLKLSFFDDAELADRIRRVKGLEEIEQFLMPRTMPASTRNLTLEIPILIKIEQPPRPIWLLVLILIVPLALVVGSLVTLNSRTRYKLKGPDGEKILSLRPIGSVPLLIADEQAGTLVRRFGALSVRSFPPFVLENGARQQRLSSSSGTFIVTNSDNNRAWTFSIEPLASGEKSEPVGSNDLFVS
jgi:hypothetical protein